MVLGILVVILIVGIIVMIMSFGASDDIWLDRFEKASTIDTEQKSFKMESNAKTFSGDILVRITYQNIGWDLDSNEPYVYTKTIYDTLLEENDPMYNSSESIWKNGVIITTTKQGSEQDLSEETMPLDELFKQIDKLFKLINFNNAYEKENFSDFKITDSQRRLQASIRDDKIGDIFGDGAPYKNMKVNVEIDSNFNFKTSYMEYSGEFNGVIVKQVSEVVYTQSSTIYAEKMSITSIVLIILNIAIGLSIIALLVVPVLKKKN